MDTQKDPKVKTSHSSQNLSTLNTKEHSSHKEEFSNSPLKIAKQLSIVSAKARDNETLARIKADYEGNTSNNKQFFSPQIHPHWSELSGLAPMRLNDDSDAPEEESSNNKNLFLNFAQPFVIGICGGNSAGKMDAVDSMIKILGKSNVTVLMQENFYKRIPNHEQALDREDYLKQYNFDDPEATDWEYMIKGLETLLEKRVPFSSPVYDFMEQKRSESTITLTPNPVIIVEGLLILHYEQIRNKLDLKIFVDTDDDIRLSRRVIKDVYKRGKDVEDVIKRYEKFVKPAYEKFVQPSKKYADIIIPSFGKPILTELEEIRQPAANLGVETYDNKAILMIIEQLSQRLKKASELQTFSKQHSLV